MIVVWMVPLMHLVMMMGGSISHPSWERSGLRWLTWLICSNDLYWELAIVMCEFEELHI